MAVKDKDTTESNVYASNVWQPIVMPQNIVYANIINE